MLARRLTISCLAALLLCFGCAKESAPPRLTLATTTSVANSGLLDKLIPLFKSETGIDVRPMAVGSGRALQLLVSGDADVAITHAPGAEAATLSGRSGWLYRKIMFNDFIIVGPPEDPAKVRSAVTAVEAMQRIASSAATFVSRGDSSGTHERERQFWKLAGHEPAKSRLVIAGSGMSGTLRVASSVGAYTLTDRATFSQLAPQLRLVTIFEGDPAMLNTYAVIVPEGHPSFEHARTFATWLSDGNGRRVIEAFKVGPQNGQAFFVWPAGVARDRPEALPK